MTLTIQDDEVEIMAGNRADILEEVGESAGMISGEITNVSVALSGQATTFQTAIANRVNDAQTALSGQMTSFETQITNRVNNKFAAFNNKFDAWTTESIRERIELNLAGPSSAPIARFMLPASAGGHLETARDIVLDTIQRMQAANEPTFHAQREFDSGVEDMAAEHFKDAYRHFGKAYKEATK